MNIGITKVLASNTAPIESCETLLMNEVAFNVAKEECQAAINDGFKLTDTIDNVFSILSVANSFGSTEAMTVIKNLVGDQLSGYSMEGFIKNVWDNFIALIKKLWGKFTKFISMLWGKIKSLFTKKKAASPAAQKFAKKHPEAAKAVEAKKGSTGPSKDSPAAVAAVCAAAPNVPVPPKAKEALKIPNPNAVGKMADVIVKDVNTVLSNMQKFLNGIYDAAKKYEDAAADKMAGNTIHDWGNGYRTVALDPSDTRAKLNDAMSVKDVVAFFGGANIKEVVTNPREHFKNKLQIEVPQKLGDISRAHVAYDAALAKLRPTIETLNKEKDRMNQALNGMKKVCAEKAKLSNQIHHEIQSKCTGAMNKCLKCVTGMFNGIVGFTSYLCQVDLMFQQNEDFILAMEEVDARNEGMNDEI